MRDLETIFNWRRIDERISTSGQPSEDQLAAIAGTGVRWVVNLGLHSHENALSDEAASVARLGMTYVHIPVDFQNPREADFEAFCAALAACGDEKVHMHCIMNYRVSAFFYRYQRDVLRMDEALARAEMERIWRPDGVWSTFIETL
jgi:protein tyrosine phosphatase (PTP) superfamily phosphohydrolase (DUF442 family)